MAFMHVITALVIVAAVATSTTAKDIVVGDYKGWTLNFDYQAWARQKEFYVGDRLIFKYPKGKHNVYRVDGIGFRQCTRRIGQIPLTSGNDVITLSSPGKKWYVCGIGTHCESGMRLVINVQQRNTSPDAHAPASAPAPAQQKLLT